MTMHDTASNKDRKQLRWDILIVTCLVILGQNFCYDLPAMAHDHLHASAGVASVDFPWYFNALYSAYSIPNLITPFVAGWVLDRVSVVVVVQVLACLSFIGHLIFTCAILGRAVFGIGNESMCVALNVILSHVFHEKEIAFALALNVSSARFGSILNNFITPSVSGLFGVSVASGIGLGFCLGSVLCSSWLTKLVDTVPNSHPSHSLDSMLDSMRSLGSRFWMVSGICVLGYCAVIPFTTVYMALRPKDVTHQLAGQILSVVFLISAIATPVIGKFVDRYGRATYVLVSSTLILCLGHTVYSAYDSISVMGILGLGYSGFVATIWPLVPLTVSEAHLGFAYGIMTALQNFGLTIMPIMFALVKSETGSYYATRWMFLGISSLSVLFSGLLVPIMESSESKVLRYTRISQADEECRFVQPKGEEIRYPTD